MIIRRWQYYISICKFQPANVNRYQDLDGARNVTASPRISGLIRGSYAGKQGREAKEGGCYFSRRSMPICTRILAEISSTEKWVELMCGIFSRRNRFSTSRISNSHWAKLA